MNSVLFILTIASLNTVLGFAIAVYLGRRYRATAPPDWDFGEEMSWADTQGEMPGTVNGESASEAVEGDSEQTPVEDGEELDVAIDQKTATALADKAQAERENQEEDVAAEASDEEIPETPSEESVTPATEPETPASQELAETTPTPTPATTPEQTPHTRETPSDLSETTEQQGAGASSVLDQEEPQPERQPTDTSDVEVQEAEERKSEPAVADISAVDETTAAAEGERTDTESAAEASRDAVEESPKPPAHTEVEGVSPEESAAEEERMAADATEDDVAERTAVQTEGAEGAKEQTPAPRPETLEEAEPPARRHVGEFEQSVERGKSGTDSDRAIEEFLAEVEQYEGQLGQADAQLRAQVEDPDSTSIRECLASLLEASREFAQKREHARNGLEVLPGETAEFEMASERLKGAIDQQDTQIESTERAIAAFPYVDDLTQGCRVMIGETTKLMDANLRVRDSLHEVSIQLARGEHRLTDLEPARRTDGLTGTESRESLEGALLQWMHSGEEQVDMLSVAVLDVDGFGQVNEEYGHSVGNELLHALGKLLIAENGSRARLARFSGERFALLFPNVDLRAAANAVERLRQIVELARFEYKKADIHITISCGVAESLGDDTPDTVMTRAEATLMEAKRYGRNRTFIHEGKYPTPVVPPKFALEPRRMTL